MVRPMTSANHVTTDPFSDPLSDTLPMTNGRAAIRMPEGEGNLCFGESLLHLIHLECEFVGLWFALTRRSVSTQYGSNDGGEQFCLPP